MCDGNLPISILSPMSHKPINAHSSQKQPDNVDVLYTKAYYLACVWSSKILRNIWRINVNLNTANKVCIRILKVHQYKAHMGHKTKTAIHNFLLTEVFYLLFRLNLLPLAIYYWLEPVWKWGTVCLLTIWSHPGSHEMEPNGVSNKLLVVCLCIEYWPGLVRKLPVTWG